jgi:hypothetical protein
LKGLVIVKNGETGAFEDFLFDWNSLRLFLKFSIKTVKIIIM